MAPRKYRMENRYAAIDETRRRIVETTVALHVEKGVIATGWDEIARRAGVAVATVYRHFPSVNELVPACGERIRALANPPTPEDATKIFAEARSVRERIESLIRELFAYYERGARFIDLALREMKQVPPLAASVRRREATLEALVREALRPLDADEQTIRIVCALTDFPLWNSRTERGLPKGVVARVVVDSVLCSIGGNGGIVGTPEQSG